MIVHDRNPGLCNVPLFQIKSASSVSEARKPIAPLIYCETFAATVYATTGGCFKWQQSKVHQIEWIKQMSQWDWQTSSTTRKQSNHSLQSSFTNENCFFLIKGQEGSPALTLIHIYSRSWVAPHTCYVWNLDQLGYVGLRAKKAGETQRGGPMSEKAWNRIWLIVLLSGPITLLVFVSLLLLSYSGCLLNRKLNHGLR